MRYFKNIVIVLSSLMVFLGLLEISLRVSEWQSSLAFYPKGMFQINSTKGYQLSPGFRGKMKREEYNVLIEVNSLGLRDKEPSEFKNDTKKIFIVGDSFVNGYFVEGSETLSARLTHLLTYDYAQNVQCINVGVSGYGLWQEILLLQEIAEKMHPDLVLLCLSQNDLSDELRYVDYTVVSGYRISKKQMPFLPLWVKASLLHFKVTYFLGERFYLLMGKLGRRDQENLRLSETIIYEKAESEPIKEGLSKISSSLQTLKNYCRSHSIKLIATYIPSRHEIYKNDWGAFTQTYNLDPQIYDPDLAETRYKILFAKNGINYLPIKAHLSNASAASTRRLYFEKDNHWNKYGIEEAAKTLTHQLMKHLGTENK